MMIDSKMIERIVEEIISQVQTGHYKSKPSLLVMYNETKNLEDDLHYLQRYWNVIKANPSEQQSYTDIQQAAFIHVNQDTLVRAALGLTDTPESKLFSQLIYHEIPIIFVLEPSLEKLLHANTTLHKYAVYIKKIYAYKEMIEKFGVSFKVLEELKPLLQSSSKKQVKPTKTLITEVDIENFNSSQLIVEPGMIITPLAIDKAKERGITISY